MNRFVKKLVVFSLILTVITMHLRGALPFVDWWRL